MWHYSLFLALLIVLIRPVRGEGRTWLSHHGAPPPPSSFSVTRRGSKAALGEKRGWVHPTTTKPVNRITPNPDLKQNNLWEENVQVNKYPYASGAFGFEPELGIH